MASWYWKAEQSKHISTLRGSDATFLIRYILKGREEGARGGGRGDVGQLGKV